MMDRWNRNIKLVVAYDGTGYRGFQLQSEGVRTIQGELERALERITGVATRVAGAGRTDAGVHALGQVASFRTDSKLQALVLQRALNALLPPDIVALETTDVAPEFHARFSALSREYRYTILNQEHRSPLERHAVYHVPLRLDVAAMAGAVQSLLGRHDFKAFAGAGSQVGATVRQILRAECRRVESKVLVDLVADAFLPHMVRNIVGGLLRVGTGRFDQEGFRAILETGQRNLCGPAAPARGLCLVRVNY